MSLAFGFLDKRPILIALAGSNGAGKFTFYQSYLADGGLFVKSHDLSASLGLLPYDAAKLAKSLRTELVRSRERFIFETMLSDPVGEQVDQLASYATLGYTVVLICIRIESPDESIRSVAMRICRRGRDVFDEKLRYRIARTQANLQRAIQRLPHVIVFSNDDLRDPVQFVTYHENGPKIERKKNG